MTDITVNIMNKDGRASSTTQPVEQVLLAGYTGRDREKVIEHIRELEMLGVAPPPRVPMVYTVSPALLTTEDHIVVRGPDTSGEAEFYLLPSAAGLLIGVGSDHTDRKQEAVDIAMSKGLCQKVISGDVWRLDDLQHHWDRIEIRSWVTIQGSRHLYQEGRLEAFVALDVLLSELKSAGHPDLAVSLVFGGTLPTIGGLVCGDRFEAELRDPVLSRALTCGYKVIVEPA